MDLCHSMRDRKCVLATKSHRGKYENMWNQTDNNFERKKILKIFWDFWGQKFRNYVILYAQKWICVVVCSIKNVFWRLKVIGENKKTCENNLITILSKKKIWNFWGQKFRKYVILYAQKMDFLQLQGGVKNF